MSKNNTLSTLDVEELRKLAKQRKRILGIIVGVVLAMSAISAYRISEVGVTVASYMPLFFIPAIFITWIELKKIREEIKSRSKSQTL